MEFLFYIVNGMREFLCVMGLIAVTITLLFVLVDLFTSHQN